MKGLIVKDLLFLKGNSKTFIILFIAFICMSFSMKGMGFSFYLPFIAIMMCITTFSYDEYNKWDIYSTSLPISRKKVVKAKYFFSFFALISSIILSFLVTSVVGLIQNTLEVEALLPSIIYGFFSISIVLSLMYPLIYKLGVEKGRVAIFIVGLIIAGIIGFVSVGVKNIPESFLTSSFMTFFTTYQYIFLTVLSFLFLYISYLISCKIYQKKEF